MSARLASGLVVSALIRRVAQEGGSAAVLARGDADAGGIVLVCTQHGEITRIIEQAYGADGRREWRETGHRVPANPLSLNDYIARRRASDGDLWVVELDIADSERFAAETIGDC